MDTGVCQQRVHEAAKSDEATWQALALVGVQMLDGRPYLELRNCQCGSTLARRCACAADDEAVADDEERDQ